METPYSAHVNLVTIPDETYKSPEKAAAIAHKLSPEKAMVQRAEYARVVAEKNEYSVGSQKLLSIIANRSEAHYTLSMIGYENLRHLQAAGMTIAEMALDLGMNQLDLMTFMSSHPESVEHAEIDTAACADMKMAEFLREVQNARPETKFEAERLRTQLQALEMLSKRLSPKWAVQMRQDIVGTPTVGVTFNMDMSGQIQAPIKKIAATVVEGA